MRAVETMSVAYLWCIHLRPASSKDTILHSVFSPPCIITLVTGRDFGDHAKFKQIDSGICGGCALRNQSARAPGRACWSASATLRCCASIGLRRTPSVTLLGKAEWYNPGGSVKDRAAANIVAEGRRTGQLRSRQDFARRHQRQHRDRLRHAGCGGRISCHSLHAENVSLERKRILQAYGANIIYTDPGEGSDGAIRMARQLASKHPDLYFYADQYSNNANWLAHYHSTANEIWQQTQGRITHFVAMLGTSGTFIGTTRRLKELNPADPVHFPAAGFRISWNRRRQAHGQRDRAQNLRS